MAIKRPKLLNRGDSAGAQNPVRIAGTCQAGDRQAEDVLITDISELGCELRLASIGVTKGEPFLLHIGAEGPITGRLRWARQGSLGVVFDAPLEDTVLARLLAAVPPSNVVALRRGEVG
jgi:hypothetical protein